MQFLEECRKVEDEDRVGQMKLNPPKAKVAVATIPPTRDDELTRQLKYQQHQIDTLVGQVKNLVSAVKATRTSSRGVSTGGARVSQTSWRGGSRGRGPLGTTPQPRARDPQVPQGGWFRLQMLSGWTVGAYKKGVSQFKRTGAVPKGECINSPINLESHSPVGQSNTETLKIQEEKELTQKANNPWTKLIGRANEEQIMINGHPVTALLDTGSLVTHISEAFCQTNNIQIKPLDKLVEIEGTGGDLIKYIGYIEATLTLPLGSHSFEIEALLLVLPSTDYQKRVPIAIGTTITDMAVEYINKSKPENLSKSWKAVCCTTQSKWLVQAQPENKFLIRTSKSVTLPPFSTTTIRGCTKLRSHGMRLNLIAEPSDCTQLPASVQCTPTYYTLEPGSTRVSVGIKNISSRAITIPSRVVVGKLQQARMVPDDQSSKSKQDPTRGEGGSWILDQLNLEGLNSWTREQQQSARDLLVDSADVFA